MKKTPPSHLHLKLVYSADANGTELETPSAQKLPEDTWGQLDLFEQPDTVIFTSPGAYPLQELVALLRRSNVSQILDLRLVPHFSFEGTTRARFIELLNQLNVKYYRLTPSSMKSADEHSGGYVWIKQYVRSGPSMVFSDVEPTRDPDISAVTAELNREGVRYKPVFATLE